jgi:AmmeMemoRadiSam system protein B
VPPFRRPFVSGQFYESDAEALKLQIKSCFLNNLGPGKLPNTYFHNSSSNNTGGNSFSRSVVGLLCPHAGYLYSGMVAASGFFELAKDGLPKTVVILGPNHSGYGSGLSLIREGFWQTPLGNIPVDTKLADQLLSKLDLLDVDESAHRFEHSIEVQLPFLQYLYGDMFKIVPLCFLMQDYTSAIEVGNTLFDVLTPHSDEVVVMASSDFTHYESAKQAEKKDHAALAAISALDAQRFYNVVEAQNISICGCAPIAALITYAKRFNAQTELLNYHNSGDVSGNYANVVGYASMLFKK